MKGLHILAITNGIEQVNLIFIWLMSFMPCQEYEWNQNFCKLFYAEKICEMGKKHKNIIKWFNAKSSRSNLQEKWKIYHQMQS